MFQFIGIYGYIFIHMIEITLSKHSSFVFAVQYLWVEKFFFVVVAILTPSIWFLLFIECFQRAHFISSGINLVWTANAIFILQRFLWIVGQHWILMRRYLLDKLNCHCFVPESYQAFVLKLLTLLFSLTRVK